MKLLTFILSFVLAFSMQDLASVRQKYLNARTSAEEARKLYEDLESDSNNSTLTAYKAAALTLRAKHEKGLLTKKKLFTQGAQLLEATIKKEPDNYEARLIRLNIQENAPKITGYNKSIDEDKSFLIKKYNSQKNDLKDFTKGFIKVSTSFTKEEKAAFLQ